MRYQCRLAGKPAQYDVQFPGTYNARRDNLEGFWKGLFGYTHGIALVSAFHENVSKHAMEQREQFDAWLNPDPRNLAALYAILDDRQRPRSMD